MQPRAYRKYLLGVLLVILVFNYVDRLALGIVLQDIKAELHLTDTQLGLLAGIAFALFYSVMGLPIARWADRGNRVAIIAATTALWSVAVVLCGTAASFIQLLLIRVGVAVGEAGCIPPALSLIADYFSRAERPRATAIYGLGGGISVVAGYFSAGWLNQAYGWRTTFMVLGTPGLALAGLAWFTLKEPRRQKSAIQQTSLAHPSVRSVCTTLAGGATFRHLLLCEAVLFFFLYGNLQWQPTFLIRSYGLASGQVGMWLAFTAGLGTLVGSYVGGEVASRYAAGNERLQLQIMAIAIAISGVLSALAYLSTNEYATLAFMALTCTGLATVNGPLFATIQTLVPERMRAVAFALVYLFANLIGMGLGPLAAGALSDSFRTWAGEESLRYSLLTLSPGFLWVAWHAWRASKTAMRDLKASQREEEYSGSVSTVLSLNE